MSKYQLSYREFGPPNGNADEWQVYKGKDHLFTVYLVSFEETTRFRVYQEQTGEVVAEKETIQAAKRWCEAAYALKMREATEIKPDNNFGLF